MSQIQHRVRQSSERKGAALQKIGLGYNTDFL